MSEEKIINFPDKSEQNKQDENTKEVEVLKASFDAITEAMPELQGMEGVAALLSMPDEQFAIIAPPILFEIEKSLNNVNDKLILTQSLNASGMKAEDLMASFIDISKQIDEKLTSIPRPKREFVKKVLGALCNAIADTEGVAKRIIQIPIELCHKDAKIPTYAHPTDAGADIYAIEDFTLAPGESRIIPAGLKVAIPLGYELQVRARSGISAKTKLILANGVGTIDTSYRGEIGVILENIEPKIKDIRYTFDETGKPIILGIEHGQSYTFSKGDRIAQLVLNEIPKAVFYQVENVEEIGENRNGGFGSTGVK